MKHCVRAVPRCCGVALAAPFAAQAQAWEPTKTVEFIVPAGTGGGADQMARVIQGDRRQAQPDEAVDRRRSTRRAAPAPRASST